MVFIFPIPRNKTLFATSQERRSPLPISFVRVEGLVPVITVVTSALILKEKATMMSGIGTVLALIGLFLSEYRGKIQK